METYLMRIKTDEELMRLLWANGWTLNGYYFECPFDSTIEFHRRNREFYQANSKLACIPNLRDFIWNYDPNTGLLSNSICAIRIK